MNAQPAPQADRGETLVELVVTIVILGIAGVAVLAGVEQSVRSALMGRNEANGGSYVRSLAEVVQNSVAAGGYAKCGSYVTAAAKTRADIPAAYSASQSAVQTWNGSAWVGCTNANDDGVQRLTLTVSSPTDSRHQATEQLVVILRRPCSGALPNPC